MWKLVGLVFVSCETGTGELSLFSLSHWVFSSSSRAARTAREGETDVGCSLHRASGGGGRLLCGRLWRGIPPQKVFRRKGGLRQPASRPGPFVSMERRVGCSSDRGGGQTGAAEATMFHVQQKLPALSGGGRGGSNIFLLGVFRAKCFGKRFGVWESRRARPHVRQSDAAERQSGQRKQQARRLRSRAVAVFETHRTDRGGLEVRESYCYCFSWCPLATNDFKRLETWTGLDCQSLSPKVVALGFATESRVDFHVSCPSC